MTEKIYLHICVFCYVHFTDRVRVLYGWASVFPIIGSISLTSFLTITFFSDCKLIQCNLFQHNHSKWSPLWENIWYFNRWLNAYIDIWFLILELGRESKYQRNGEIEMEPGKYLFFSFHNRHLTTNIKHISNKYTGKLRRSRVNICSSICHNNQLKTNICI